MTLKAQEVHLIARPNGKPVINDFAIVEKVLPALAPYQLLVRNRYFSVDPYMRLLMDENPGFAPPYPLNEVLTGAAIGEVISSTDATFPLGSIVTHFSGWRDYAVIDSSTANVVINPDKIPLPAYLNTLGAPGLTAYAGLLRFGLPKANETVFVSAAGGAVGAIVVQIAKLKGCKVIASAGAPEKLRWLQDALKVDALINYRETKNISQALRELAPEGIDIYFNNVGGDHLNAAIENANTGARIILCGNISDYNSAKGFSAEEKSAREDITMIGFDADTQYDIWPEFSQEMKQWITEGKIISRETIITGIENSPAAFIGLFTGDNIGKMLVKLPSTD